MSNDDINVVSLSKGIYDSLRETNSRAKMLLDEILSMDNISLSDDETTSFSQTKLLTTQSEFYSTIPIKRNLALYERSIPKN